MTLISSYPAVFQPRSKREEAEGKEREEAEAEAEKESDPKSDKAVPNSLEEFFRL